MSVAERYVLAQTLARMRTDLESCREAVAAMMQNGSSALLETSVLAHWVDQMTPILAHGSLVLAAVLSGSLASRTETSLAIPDHRPTAPHPVPRRRTHLYGPGEMKRTILKLLADGEDWSDQEVLDRLRVDKPSTPMMSLWKCVSCLISDGHLVRVRKGTYRLPHPHLSVVGQ